MVCSFTDFSAAIKGKLILPLQEFFLREVPLGKSSLPVFLVICVSIDFKPIILRQGGLHNSSQEQLQMSDCLTV